MIWYSRPAIPLQPEPDGAGSQAWRPGAPAVRPACCRPATMGDAAMAHEAETIDPIIARLSAIVDEAKVDGSRHGYFAALYRFGLALRSPRLRPVC